MLRRALSLIVLLAPTWAAGHGINGHVHVTGWAIEVLPPGELRDFFADPSLRDAAQIGASFPDSGYAIDHPYGEAAHWEPFLDALVEHVRATYGPDYDDAEARHAVAFLMGVAAHGMQDELFDSVFLHLVRQHDGEGQEGADPGTDAFLYTDGHLEFAPPVFLPADLLIPVFAQQGIEVEADTMVTGMNRVKFLVIDNFAAVAPGLDERWRPRLAWTAEHYLDPHVPGSLGSEVPATAAYLQALWERLHDRFPAASMARYAWPAPGHRLLSRDPAEAESWITVVFGTGARVGSLDGDTVVLLDAEGAPVSASVRHTRWSGRPEDITRLVQLRPSVELAPDAEYTVRVEPGVELVDGRVVDAAWSYTFRTPCAPAPCEEPPPEVPERVPYPSADAAADAAPPDAGSDVGVDAGGDAAFAGEPESDASGPTLDAHRPSVDASRPTDSGAAMAGARSDDGGCAVTDASGAGWLALLALWGSRRRRLR